MEEELHMDSSVFALINLRSIAFENDREELIKLIEMVICAIVNCPKNEQYINNLLRLDEDTQRTMKVIIEKSISSQPLDPIELNGSFEEEEFIELRKYEAIKEEKISLLETIEKLQIENHKLQEKLEDKGYKTPTPRKKDDEIFQVNRDNADLAEINAQLEEQLVKIQVALSKERDDKEAMKKHFKQEKEQLMDDLDIAKAQVNNFEELNKRVKQYKKRLEDFESLRAKVKEKDKKLERMQKEVADRDIRLSKYISYKKQVEELNLTTKTQTAQLENMRQKVQYKVNEIEILKNEKNELKRELEELRYRAAEDNPASGESSFISMVSHNSLALLDRSPNNFKSQYEDELQDMKEKKHLMKENHKLQLEECRTIIANILQDKEKYIEDNLLLNQNIKEITKQLMSYEGQIFDIEDLTYRNDELQNSLQQASKNNEEISAKLEKTQTQKRELEEQLRKTEQEFSALKTADSVKQSTIESLRTEKKASEEYIESLSKDSANKDKELEVKVHKLQGELQSSLNKISGLKAKLKESRESLVKRDEHFNNIVKDMESDYSEKTKNLVSQYEEKLKDMRNENLVALGALMKKQEFLKFARSEGENSQNMKFYQRKLLEAKEELRSKEEELDCLLSANRELKKGWKEATDLLETVWAEIGKETKKIQQVMHRRSSKKHL